MARLPTGVSQDGGRTPDAIAGTRFVLFHPEQDDASVSQHSVEILVKDYKDHYKGIPAPAYYRHRFYARPGQEITVAQDWYRHMDDLNEAEVPVLVTSCDEYEGLQGADGQVHQPDRVDAGFFVSGDHLADCSARLDPPKKRIDLTLLSDVSDDEDDSDAASDKDPHGDGGHEVQTEADVAATSGNLEAGQFFRLLPLRDGSLPLYSGVQVDPDRVQFEYAREGEVHTLVVVVHPHSAHQSTPVMVMEPQGNPLYWNYHSHWGTEIYVYRDNLGKNYCDFLSDDDADGS